MLVAQPVVDEGEQLGGRGDLADVLAAAGLDACTIDGKLRGGGLVLDGLDRRPSDQFAALLGDVPTMDDGVRLVVTRGQSRPRTQPVRSRKPLAVSDFGDEYRTEDRTNAGQLLNDAVAGMVPQLAGDRGGEVCLMAVEDVDHLEQ